jgi:hypothetical protein
MAMEVQCIGRDTFFGTFRMQNLLFVKTANFIIFKAPFNSNGIQNFPHPLKITRQSKGNKTSSHF